MNELIIRVVIADDHPVVLQGLTAILKSAKDIKVVGEATDGDQTCELYDQLSPDVLMLDLRMPMKDGLEVVAELMSRPRVPKVTWSKGQVPNKSEKLCGESLKEKFSFPRRSPRNLQNRCLILNSRSVSLKFCSTLPTAEAIRK